MSNAPVSATSQPMQRRPSSVREESPMASMVGDSMSASGGRDVTPTSPSNASSLVSIRPLPPPSLYQPPAPSALERKNSVSSISTRGSFSTPNMPSTSPSPVMGEAPASAATSSSKGSVVGKGKENTGRWQAEEHEIFLKGLNEHGKQWKKIAMMIKTRSVVQVRTHAQKYFQKLLKNEKKEEGRQGKERSSSILSTSTAVSTSTASTAVKRKSSTKGNNRTTIAGSAAIKKRRVSLEPKKQPYHAMDASMQHVHYQAPPHLMASAPTMPVASGPVMTQNNPGEHTIDPSFMNTLNMAEGELDDSLLELLDDSSVEAVEQVIGNDDDIELDVDVEPTPVSPSVSSASLTDTSAVEPTPTAEVMHHDRHDIVSSPQPEDFSIHNTIGTSSVSGRELSPTSVACMMDIKDFEQKTSSYVDALDWLMDVGVHQLPATAGEDEEDWSNGQTSMLPPAPKISHSRLAQVNSSALSVLEDDVF